MNLLVSTKDLKKKKNFSPNQRELPLYRMCSVILSETYS